MVMACQMRALMGKHVSHILLRDRRGQINPRPKQAKDKRRVDPVTEPNVFMQQHRCSHPTAQTQVADQSIQQQRSHTDQPDYGRNFQIVYRFNCRRFYNDSGILHCVGRSGLLRAYIRHLDGRIRNICLCYARENRVSLRNQTELAL